MFTFDFNDTYVVFYVHWKNDNYEYSKFKQEEKN
jgi:hypothetical protein